MNVNYHSNGKLLLTGEYAVLDGALALALPCQPGQSLSVAEHQEAGLAWQSLDHNNAIWFETRFEVSEVVSNPTRSQFPKHSGHTLIYLAGCDRIKS